MDWERARPLLRAVLDLPEADRDAALARACDEDSVLLSELRALLAAGRERSDLFEAPSHAAAKASFATGDEVGKWRLEAFLGAGGMGEVWIATRAEFGQRAAVKIVRRGFAGPDAVARFERERRVLADLEHPGIARFLDGGTLPDGRPWLAMDAVDGRPIDAYCREERLDVPARVQLFTRVIEAVEAAHQRLVVHRDLKPSNVLVQDDGTPRLVDFGIAKVLPDEGQDGTVTRAEARAFTPRYASPEQIEGRPVSTRSDVYSLGVLLYELLTSASPYGETTSSIQVMRAACEEEPTRPSQAIERLDADALPCFGADGQRQTLRRRLTGELDWIVMTALRKEPERRYASVGAFAADLRRVLAGEPVEAGPDSASYRARKFVQRNRVVVAATGLTFVALLAATAVSLASSRRAQESARDAQESARDALHAAAEERAALEAASGALSFLRQLVMAPSPDRGRGRDTLVRDALMLARGQVDTLESAHARFASHTMIAAALADLGEVDAAIEHYREAVNLGESLGEQGPMMAETYHEFALTLAMVGRTEECLPLVQRGLEIVDDPASSRLDAIMEPRDRRVIRVSLLNVKASILETAGREAEALEVFHQALEAAEGAPGHEEFATMLRFNIGGVLVGRGELEEGLRKIEQAHDELARTGDARSSLAIQIGTGLTLVLAFTGRAVEGVERGERTVALSREVLGPSHLLTWDAEYSLAFALFEAGRIEECEKLALALGARTGADSAEQELMVECLPAMCWARTGRAEAAYDRLEPLVARAEVDLVGEPATHGHLLLAWTECLATLGERAAARTQLIAASEHLERWAGPDHPFRPRVAALARDLGLEER